MNKKYIDHISLCMKKKNCNMKTNFKNKNFCWVKSRIKLHKWTPHFISQHAEKICTTKNIVNYSFFFDGADTHLWKIQVWFSICMWMHAIRINKSIHGEINATFGKPKGVYLSSKKNKEDVLLYQLGYG